MSVDIPIGVLGEAVNSDTAARGLRTVKPEERDVRESAKCRICQEPTWDKKPYCTEHVEEHDYIKKLRQEEKEREEQEERFKKTGQVYILDHVVLDIWGFLQGNGQSSTKKISRQANIDLDLVNAVVKVLAANNLVQLVDDPKLGLVAFENHLRKVD